MIRTGKSFIPKDDDELGRYRKIYPEMAILANGTLLYQDRIILPESLHKQAIKLAHCGAHPGQIGLARRLRSHFFITDLDVKVKDFVSKCLRCQTFTDKLINEPIQPNAVPEQCWEEVSVDLFGPLTTRIT